MLGTTLENCYQEAVTGVINGFCNGMYFYTTKNGDCYCCNSELKTKKGKKIKGSTVYLINHIIPDPNDEDVEITKLEA